MNTTQAWPVRPATWPVVALGWTPVVIYRDGTAVRLPSVCVFDLAVRIARRTIEDQQDVVNTLVLDHDDTIWERFGRPK